MFYCRYIKGYHFGQKCGHIKGDRDLNLGAKHPHSKTFLSTPCHRENPGFETALWSRFHGAWTRTYIFVQNISPKTLQNISLFTKRADIGL